jgi:phage host-nuclease inhibitor protein Gam
MIDDLRKLNNPEINELLDRLVALDDPSTVLDKLKELESNINEKVTHVTEDFSHYIEQLKEEIQKVADTIPDKGNPGEKGEPGKDGKDYILTTKDKKEIAKSIEVPVIEKVIERVETIREIPLITKQITNEVKEVAVTDTPELIRGKLETLKKDARLDISAIRGLDDYGDLEDDVEKLTKKIDKIKKEKSVLVHGGGGTDEKVKLNASDPTAGYLDDKITGYGFQGTTFESVSKNLRSYPYALNYTGSSLTSIVYTLPSGIITKTLNYSGDTLTSIVLSGDTPSGISLTKTLNWSGDTLTAITYS